MMEISIVNSKNGYVEVCELLHRTQRIESEATGVLFNTNKLTADELQKEIESNSVNRCLGAYEDGSIIGTLSIFQDKKKRWYTEGKNCFEIKYVAVAPEAQGKHVGSSLLDYAKTTDGYDILNISTGEKNTNAIRFYEKNGFTLVDVSRGPIHNAYKLAYWRDEYPFKQNTIKRHVLLSKVKCFIKKIVIRPTVSKEMFQ